MGVTREEVVRPRVLEHGRAPGALLALPDSIRQSELDKTHPKQSEKDTTHDKTVRARMNIRCPRCPTGHDTQYDNYRRARCTIRQSESDTHVKTVIERQDTR